MLEDDCAPESFQCESCGNIFVREPRHHVWLGSVRSWFRENTGALSYAGLAALVIAVLAGVLNTAVAEIGESPQRTGVVMRTESVPGGIAEGAVGRGLLKVMNDSGSAIALRLIGPQYGDSRTVLVPAWGDGRVFNLVPGTWTVKYCTGSQWRPEARRFEFTAACGELDQTIEYTETIEDEALKYGAAVVRFGLSPREMPPAHPITADNFAAD
jgi:hypothetical protein